MGDTLELIPGRMNVVARVGDDLSITLVAKQGGAAIDLTGYTFESKVDIGGSFVAFTVVNTNFATGIIVLTMTDTLSAGIPAVTTNSWYLDRTNAGNQRRWVSGDFIGIEYKK